MSRERQKKKGIVRRIIEEIEAEAFRGITSIVLFALGVFLSLAPFGIGGFLGVQIERFFLYLFGNGYILMPILSFFGSYVFLRNLSRNVENRVIIALGILLFSGLSLFEVSKLGNGGVIGKIIARGLLSLLDRYGSFIVIVTLITVGSILLFNKNLSFGRLGNSLSFFKRIIPFLNKKEVGDVDEDDSEEMPVEDQDEEEVEDGEYEKNTNRPIRAIPAEKPRPKAERVVFDRTYVPPPLSLLAHDKGKPEVGDIKANANIIKRTLQNFGIQVEMDEVTIGPSVTRYALKPAQGVKLSKILSLQNDLSLALAAHPIRIEAPIPGKSLVGIEIPNTVKSTVGLGGLLSHDDFQNASRPLTFAIGKGVSGKLHFASLDKMPHLLIAGATGSGKSVTIHTLITSLLYRNSPQDMRFIFIDPKRVELTLYNKIPHLLSPVITDARKAIMALKWAAKEMEERYNVLQSESVRDIDSYHKNVIKPHLEKMAKSGKDEDPENAPRAMPYIVIVIDELADIMSTYPRELEAGIVRLAQMSRAVGIHLVLSTQRPSVNVITGLIKANVPARIALQVASQVDSRTIIDMSGAEKLLGAGDMLFMSGDMSKPMRVQSAYISEAEVKAVTRHLADQQSDALYEVMELTVPGNDVSVGGSGQSGGDDDIDDGLYEAAREAVIEAGRASTSYLQRKLRIGYSRAARIIDMLEERNVIGPADGSKPRPVIDSGTGGEPSKNE